MVLVKKYTMNSTMYTVISYYIYTIQVLDGNNSIARLADYQMTRLYL
jgi:hypothetical protein